VVAGQGVLVEASEEGDRCEAVGLGGGGARAPRRRGTSAYNGPIMPSRHVHCAITRSRPGPAAGSASHQATSCGGFEVRKDGCALR
jgi:hypothetical protein